MTDPVASIRARHKSAKPNVQENPAWFHAEQDIARLLIVIDDLRSHICDLPDSIKDALNSGDGVYRP